jgi:hypothetical protein
VVSSLADSDRSWLRDLVARQPTRV